MPANVFVFEGSWDRPNEAPQVLPFLGAYAQTFNNINLNHRTIRNAGDLKFYLAKIPKGSKSFLYITCHGDIGELQPSDKKNKISMPDLKEALSVLKDESVAFLHFGCCNFFQQEEGSRRKHLSEILASAKGAKWTSGYTKEVDWLASTLLDLAFISEIYVPWRIAKKGARPDGKTTAEFLYSYEQLIRSLGFSAFSELGGKPELIPRRIT